MRAKNQTDRYLACLRLTTSVLLVLFLYMFVLPYEVIGTTNHGYTQTLASL
jgi:hypothetical protein